MQIFEFLAPIYYEFLAKFVPRKVSYARQGSCQKCAKCCRYLTCKGLASKREFVFLQFIFPSYRNFKIVGKDEFGNYILRCKLIDKDNLCPIHPNRPLVCRSYPPEKISRKIILHKDCGFSVEPEKKFKDFL